MTEAKPNLDPSTDETQDEIDKIMSEIEALQKEMDSVAPDQNPAVAVTPAPAVEKSEKLISDPVPAAAAALPPKMEINPEAPMPEPTSESTSIETSPSVEGVVEGEIDENTLKEFSGDGEEPWLEETFANLKNRPSEEIPDTGTSPFDIPSHVAPLPTSEEEAPKESSEELPENSMDESEELDEEDLLRELEAEEKSTQEQVKIAKQPPQHLNATPTHSQAHLQSSPHSFSSRQATPAPRLSHESAGGGSLSMSIRGDMTIALNYDDGAQQVDISFTENVITILFADGLEFKVPFRR